MGPGRLMKDCFLMPYKIEIRRPTRPTNVGPQTYSGVTMDQEEVLRTGVQANIRLARTGRQIFDLPADTSFRAYFYIVFKGKKGSVKTHDIIVDDTGRRFQVTSDAWSSMGFQVLAELLEV